MEEYKEINGKIYLVKKCLGCGNEMLFSLHDEVRRVHGACAKCGKSIEVEVPAKKKQFSYFQQEIIKQSTSYNCDNHITPSGLFITIKAKKGNLL